MADASCPGIVSNPDLIGIGTRLNFYVTILLAAIIPKSEYTVDLLNELYMNAVFFGHALLITVLVKTMQGRLDMFHAIFVMHMLIWLSFFQVCGMKASVVAWRYTRHGLRRKIIVTFQLFQVLFIFPAWALYVWTKGPRFGSQSQCSHLIKYVLVFVTVRATVNWLRILFTGFIALTICMSLVALPVILKAPLTASDISLGESVRRVQDRRGWFLRFFYLPTTTLLVAYGIVHAELIIHRNRLLIQAGDYTWGLGQVVSVLLLLPIFVELSLALSRWYTGRSLREERAEVLEEVQEDKQDEQEQEQEQEHAQGQTLELAEINVVQDNIV